MSNLKENVDVLTNELKNDADFRRVWQDNISMSFQDQYNNTFPGNPIPNIVLKDIADKAANNFLDILCM